MDATQRNAAAARNKMTSCQVFENCYVMLCHRTCFPAKNYHDQTRTRCQQCTFITLIITGILNEFRCLDDALNWQQFSNCWSLRSHESTSIDSLLSQLWMPVDFISTNFDSLDIIQLWIPTILDLPVDHQHIHLQLKRWIGLWLLI
jgi:hypothetical protein